MKRKVVFLTLYRKWCIFSIGKTTLAKPPYRRVQKFHFSSKEVLGTFFNISLLNDENKCFLFSHKDIRSIFLKFFSAIAESDSDGFDTYRRFSSGQIAPETLPGALLCRTVLHLFKLSVWGKEPQKMGKSCYGYTTLL